MKKGCVIVVGLLLLAVGVPGSLVLLKKSQEYGLTNSPMVSHEALARPDTSLRVTLEPARARDLITALIGSDIEIPSWLPFDLKTALDQVMPREIALLATPDYAAGELGFTLFMNEKRLGPRLVEAINARKPLAGFTQMRWDEEGFSLPERGVVSAHGTTDLPDAFEEDLLQYWSPRRRPVTTRTEGGHLFEAVLDHRHGDGFMLWATSMKMAGTDWKTVLRDARYQQMLELSVYVDEIRLTADLADVDTLGLHIAMVADPTVGANLVGVLNMAFSFVESALRTAYKMETEGDFVWDEQGSAIVGDFTITGIYAEMKRQRDLLLAAQP